MIVIATFLISLAYADIPQDQQLHAIGSYAINTTALAAQSKRAKFRQLKAAGFTISLGLAKEIADPEFSKQDMTANLIGIITSSICSWIIEF